MLPAQPNRSLIDGLACLQALAASAEPVGVRALARQLGLEPTRASRLLKTLAHMGLLQQTPDRLYGPGPGMHVLAAQSLFASGLIRRALVPLESLHRFGQIVALGVLWRDQVSYLYHGEPGMPVSTALGRVGLYPATRSSIGMALLAQRSEREVRGLFKGREIPGFAGGIAPLLAELRRCRARGFSLLREEHDRAHVTMAVPVGLPPAAAVALSGRIRKPQVDHLVAALRDVATVIGSEYEKCPARA